MKESAIESGHTPEEEWLDLVDENDQVVGKKRRSEIYAEGLRNYRVVNGFLRNSEWKLLVLRRSPNKKMFPSALDMSMGGHVESGESYEAAFARELREELGIDAAKSTVKQLGKVTPKDNVSSFMQVYEIATDQMPDFNEQDFSEAFWLSPEELLARIEGGEKSKEDLPKLVRMFY